MARINMIIEAEVKRLPGQYYDSETNLHYNYFRDYDPSTGRYIQSDPIGVDYDYSNPMLQVSINHGMPIDNGYFPGLDYINLNYGYVDNSPIVFIDPFGLEPARGGRGETGGTSGHGTGNPYKKCKEDPTDPTKIICKDKKSGKKITKPKPADWDNYKKEVCGEECQQFIDVIYYGGTAYLIYRCARMVPSLFPPLWPTIPVNAAAP